MRLAELSTTKIADLAPLILAVPVGSCEQHGPHLPLGTDTLVAETLAARLSDRVPGVVVTPSMSITASGEHAGFPGTLSIGVAATTAVLVELVRSADWCAGVVFVNGHGGNAEPVGAATRRLRDEGRKVLAWWPPPLAPPHDAHAGFTETSLLLAIAPALVDRTRLQPGTTTPLAELAPSLRTGGVAAVSPSGVLGDPRAATLDAGTQLLDLLTDDLVAATRRIATGDWQLDLTRPDGPERIDPDR